MAYLGDDLTDESCLSRRQRARALACSFVAKSAPPPPDVWLRPPEELLDF